MKLSKRIILDFLPLLILGVSAIISLLIMITSNFIIQWQHYLGIFFLILNGITIYKNHQLGILFLGLTIFFGVVGILSFNVGIIGSSFYWNPFGIKIPLFIGNPIMLILLIIYFILSGRYYVGILTKSYWKKLFESWKRK